MTALSRLPVFALAIAATSVVLDLPAGAQVVGGRSAFDARPGLEFVQFGDFWGDPDDPTGTISLIRFGVTADRLVQIIPMIRTIIGGRNRRRTK